MVQLNEWFRIWISESIIFNFRIWIGYGFYEKVSDWIRIAKFLYPYTTDSECIYVCCVNGFRFDSHLGAFHFGSSLMLALVKGSLFCFLQMFPNFCVQIYSFGLVH